MSNIYVKSLILIIFTSFFVACASTTEDNIQRVSVGMSKAQVLDTVGDPKSTDRSNSVDEWTYRYYTPEDREKFVKVYFKSGSVIKVKAFDPNDDELSGSYKRLYKKSSRRTKKQKREI